MSNAPRAGGRAVAPILVDGSITGAEVAMDAGKGTYTLAANSTYVYNFGGPTAAFESVTLTGYAAALIISSATIQDTDHEGGPNGVTSVSTVVGEWLPETPTTAYVPFIGTGWSAANAVVAAAGTGVGGARWNIAETAAYRTRLVVVTGAAGGPVRVSMHGKG